MSQQNVHRYTVDGITCEKRGPSAPTSLIFSHGIEGGIDDGNVQHVAEGYAAIAPIVCWEGTRSLSERIASFHTVIAHEDAQAVIGGRSMGARAAVAAAQTREDTTSMLVLVSWPLFAGKNGEQREPERREQILIDLPATMDVLFVIGTEDSQCPLAAFAEIRQKMKAKSWLVEVRGANHKMEQKPTQANRPMRMMTGRLTAEWLQARDESKRSGWIEWNEKENKVIWSGWA